MPVPIGLSRHSHQLELTATDFTKEQDKQTGNSARMRFIEGNNNYSTRYSSLWCACGTHCKQLPPPSVRRRLSSKRVLSWLPLTTGGTSAALNTRLPGIGDYSTQCQFRPRWNLSTPYPRVSEAENILILFANPSAVFQGHFYIFAKRLLAPTRQ